MKYFFSLEISGDQVQVDKISKILGIEPNYPEVEWGYRLKINDDSYTNFIDQFLAILDHNYDELSEIGVKREDISVWMIYEYEDQCNIEFSPIEMKKLGDNGITLCISCYKA